MPESAAQTELVAQEEPVSIDERPDRARLVLTRLLAAHKTWFDVSRDYELAGRTFPGFAAFHQHGERYVLSKKAQLWAVANHEYILFDIVESFDEDALAADIAFMKDEAFKLVDPTEPDHMSTAVGLIVIAGSASEAARKALRRTRYRKNFKLGLAGWSDLRLALVDLSVGENGAVFVNAAAKTWGPTLKSNLAPAQIER